nr:annexin homolog [Giardia intestinalis]
MANKNYQMSTGVTAVVQKVVEACQDESKRLDLIEIARSYPPNQLRNMQRTFQAITGTFLDAFLKKHLSKDFESLVLMLYKPRAQLLCELIRGATKGAGTDEKCLVDVLLTIETHEVREIRQLYYQLYNDSLGDVVRKDCGDKYMWAKLINAVATGDRIPRDTHELEEDLVLVRKAIETKGVKKDEVSTWIRIFATYTRADFRQLHKMYSAKYNGDSLRAGVEDEFQGLDEYAFKLAHDFLYDPCCAAAFSMNVALQAPEATPIGSIESPPCTSASAKGVSTTIKRCMGKRLTSDARPSSRASMVMRLNSFGNRLPSRCFRWMTTREASSTGR